jgi:hypothetical protein
MSAQRCTPLPGLLCVALLATSACSNPGPSGSAPDAGTPDAGTPDAGAPDGGSADGGGFPAPPHLGTILDRVGRPFVNVAITDPFDLLSGTSQGQEQDTYNAAPDPQQWVARFSSTLETSLALWDGVDGRCGDQWMASPLAQAGRYKPLANLIADDRLYLSTLQGTCSQYLALELGSPSTDCGGRTPLEDTADVTYTLLTVGLDGGAPAISNGVSADADGTVNLSVFPFLGAPH